MSSLLWCCCSLGASLDPEHDCRHGGVPCGGRAAPPRGLPCLADPSSPRPAQLPAASETGRGQGLCCALRPGGAHPAAAFTGLSERPAPNLRWLRARGPNPPPVGSRRPTAAGRRAPPGILRHRRASSGLKLSWRVTRLCLTGEGQACGK